MASFDPLQPNENDDRPPPGRAADVDSLLSSVREAGHRRLVQFLGSTGVGKTSLLRVGLAPRLCRELGATVVYVAASRLSKEGADVVKARIESELEKRPVVLIVDQAERLSDETLAGSDVVLALLTQQRSTATNLFYRVLASRLDRYAGLRVRLRDKCHLDASQTSISIVGGLALNLDAIHEGLLRVWGGVPSDPNIVDALARGIVSAADGRVEIDALELPLYAEATQRQPSTTAATIAQRKPDDLLDEMVQAALGNDLRSAARFVALIGDATADDPSLWCAGRPSPHDEVERACADLTSGAAKRWKRHSELRHQVDSPLIREEKSCDDGRPMHALVHDRIAMSIGRVLKGNGHYLPLMLGIRLRSVAQTLPADRMLEWLAHRPDFSAELVRRWEKAKASGDWVVDPFLADADRKAAVEPDVVKVSTSKAVRRRARVAAAALVATAMLLVACALVAVLQARERARVLALAGEESGRIALAADDWETVGTEAPDVLLEDALWQAMGVRSVSAERLPDSVLRALALATLRSRHEVSLPQSIVSPCVVSGDDRSVVCVEHLPMMTGSEMYQLASFDAFGRLRGRAEGTWPSTEPPDIEFSGPFGDWVLGRRNGQFFAARFDDPRPTPIVLPSPGAAWSPRYCGEEQRHVLFANREFGLADEGDQILEWIPSTGALNMVARGILLDCAGDAYLWRDMDSALHVDDWNGLNGRHPLQRVPVSEFYGADGPSFLARLAGPLSPLLVAGVGYEASSGTPRLTLSDARTGQAYGSCALQQQYGTGVVDISNDGAVVLAGIQGWGRSVMRVSSIGPNALVCRELEQDSIAASATDGGVFTLRDGTLQIYTPNAAGHPRHVRVGPGNHFSTGRGDLIAVFEGPRPNIGGPTTGYRVTLVRSGGTPPPDGFRDLALYGDQTDEVFEFRNSAGGSGGPRFLVPAGSDRGVPVRAWDDDWCARRDGRVGTWPGAVTFDGAHLYVPEYCESNAGPPFGVRVAEHVVVISMDGETLADQVRDIVGGEGEPMPWMCTSRAADQTLCHRGAEYFRMPALADREVEGIGSLAVPTPVVRLGGVSAYFPADARVIGACQFGDVPDTECLYELEHGRREATFFGRLVAAGEHAALLGSDSLLEVVDTDADRIRTCRRSDALENGSLSFGAVSNAGDLIAVGTSRNMLGGGVFEVLHVERDLHCARVSMPTYSDVVSAVFDSSGSTLAVAERDGRIHVLRIGGAESTELVEIWSMDVGETPLALRERDGRLWVLTDDGSIHLLPFEPQAVVADACEARSDPRGRSDPRRRGTEAAYERISSFCVDLLPTRPASGTDRPRWPSP